MNQIKVAFIGTGNMGTQHAKAFASFPDVKLVGALGRSHERTTAFSQSFQIPNVCSTIEELYERTQADLLVVSVSELETKEILRKAFKFPWKILVEKPVGYNLEEAKEILEISRQNKSNCFVAFNRRHYGSTRSLLSQLHKDNFPRLVQVCDQEDTISARKANRPEAVVQNWMYANSIHLIDYFQFLGRGSITSVENIHPWTGDDSTFVAAKITYSSGDIGIYQALWNCPGPWSVTVTTAEKRWDLKPLEKLSVQKMGTRVLDFAEDDPWDTEFKPGLKWQAQEALKAVRGEPNDLPTLGESLKTMELVKALYS